MQIKVRTANGPVLLRDAGIIGLEATFDQQTGEQLSARIIVDKGPHPEADSDRFCSVITSALA